MHFLIGQETCEACGDLNLVVTQHLTGNFSECDVCGGDTSVAVWFPSDAWPEVEGLATFDAERQRLHLPPMWTWPLQAN